VFACGGGSCFRCTARGTRRTQIHARPSGKLSALSRASREERLEAHSWCAQRSLSLTRARPSSRALKCGTASFHTQLENVLHGTVLAACTPSLLGRIKRSGGDHTGAATRYVFLCGQFHTVSQPEPVCALYILLAETGGTENMGHLR
jgi:hypothetical protein